MSGNTDSADPTAMFGLGPNMIYRTRYGINFNRWLGRRFRFAICAIAKNEAAYLAEWIAYHLAIGFEHIFIYDNDSNDGTARFTMDRWKSRVTIVRWPSVLGASPQRAAYQDFVERYKYKVTWTAFIDIDEFINLKKHSSIGEFLSDYPKAQGVGINWRVFGSSNKTEKCPGLVIDRFTLASRYGEPVNRHIKTIAKTKYIENTNIHNHNLVDNTKFVSPDNTRLKSGPKTCMQTHSSFDVVQINHYFTKSYEEFLAKMNRGRADFPPECADRYRKVSEFRAHDYNDEEDLTILRWREKVALKLHELTGTTPTAGEPTAGF